LRPMARSTPARARTAPNRFSTPSSSTIAVETSTMRRWRLSGASLSLLHVGLDRLDRVLLRVLRAGDATRRNVRQGRFEGILGEGEIGHQQVVRNVLVAVEDLLGDPEGKRRDSRRDGGRPGHISIGVLLLFPPRELVLAVAHDDDGRRTSGGLEGL